MTERGFRKPQESIAVGAPAIAGLKRLRKKRQRLDLGVLEGHLGYFVRRLQVRLFQDFMQKLASFDIRPAQYSVIVVIEANPGLSQAELADALGIERARMVRMLDVLERRGFTRRQQSPHDRRTHALFLTPEGQKNLKRIKSLGAEHEAAVTKRLGPERRDLLLKTLRGDDGPRSPRSARNRSRGE